MRSDVIVPPHAVEVDWAELSGIPGIADGWAHSGLAVTSAGDVVGFHAGQLVFFGEHGRPRRIIRTSLTEGHGITLDQDGDEEVVWVADPGFLFVCAAGEGDPGLAALFGEGIRQATAAPRVVQMTLDGRIRRELPLPPEDPSLGPGLLGSYRPTDVAVVSELDGGNGDVWVADGYGVSVVHRFNKDGELLGTLTGEEGDGRFNCPHSVYLSQSRPEPELYIADRSNSRVQVYDIDGRFRRSFGSDVLNSPSGFAHWKGLLVVAELFGRLTAFDEEDRFVGYLGRDHTVDAASGWPSRPGWPNMISSEGRARRPALADTPCFNSPHSVATDAAGNLFVSEWLIGARYSKVSEGSQ